MTNWTVKQLWDELQNDLTQCNTTTERSCCMAIGKKEIRQFAAGLSRKLTPIEAAILEQC